MYFVNEDHKDNYFVLMGIYGYRIGLADVFGSIGSSREALKVFFEACDIRTKGKLKGAIK